MSLQNTAHNRQLKAKRVAKLLARGAERMIVPRGTARAARRLAAKKVLSGKGFFIYWNGGKPSPRSLVAAVAYSNERDSS